MTNFDSRIRELIAHAYAHAPAIKQIMDDAGVSPDAIQGTADLKQIPILSKDALVAIHQKNPPFGGFLTINPDDLPRIFISPGPIFDPQPPVEDPDAALAPFRYVGFSKGDRVLNTFTYHLTPAGALLEQGINGVGATTIPFGPGNSDLLLHVAQALKASGFVGQPSYLMGILDKVEAAGGSPDTFPIKKALFSAEPYTPSQQARFEGEWGMKTTSAYGTADLGFIGYTVEGVQGFCLTDNVYVQIVDPDTGADVEPGAIGEIVVTTFNKSYPLIRFGTGDLGALAPQTDAKCTGSQQLTGLFGRSGAAIKVRGMFLHPSQLKAAVGQFPQIKTLQAVITRPDNKDVVTLKVLLNEGASSAGVAEQLQQLAQAAVRLRIDSVEFVDALADSDRMIIDQRTWE